ncbi:MAG: NBR1-Ig-like domain-containing protein [Anaerolineaceae bacterium]|jgi:hypothetical protein
MKNVIWNILAVLALMAIVALAFVFLNIYSNPKSTFNPFPPPTVPANLVIPTSTSTPILLPATWTPKPATPTPNNTNFNLITRTYTLTPSETSQALVIKPSITPNGDKYSCEISVDKPLDGSMVDYGSNFNGQWIIMNDGTEPWDHTRVQARYITGTKLQTKKDFVNLPRDVNPGSSVNLSLDMTAPSDVGTYYATWGLMEGDTVICRWTFAIRIPKPPPSPTPTQ